MAREPLTVDELKASSGVFTDYSLTCGEPSKVRGHLLAEHPWVLNNMMWIEGRGGVAKAEYVWIVGAHDEVPGDEGPYHIHDYAVYLSGDGVILGWVEVTERPSWEEIAEHYRRHPE